MLFEILEKVVAVEGAKCTGGRSGLQAPDLQNVGITIRTPVTHLHQGEAVVVQGIRTCPATLFLLHAKPDVHEVCLLIPFTEPLPFFVAQQVPAQVFGDRIDLVIDGTVPWHFCLMPVRTDCPPWDTDRPA